MIGFIIIAVVVLILIIYVSKKDKSSDSLQDLLTDSQQNDFETQEIENDDFSTNFFERHNDGEKEQLFLTVSAQQDAITIRSLLAAENIPSIVQDENINRMYGGSCLTGMFCQKIFILINDYEKAFELVSEYLNNKRKNQSENPTETKVATVLAAALVYPIVNDVTIQNVTVHAKAEK